MKPLPLTNAYTNSPRLNPNLATGTVQLAFWVFFHPSAWRSHIQNIDGSIRPDFTVADLSWTQLKNKEVLKLLMQSFLIWPLIIGTPWIVKWGLKGYPAVDVAGIIAIAVAVSVNGILVCGVASAIAAGAVCMILMATIGGVSVGINGDPQVGAPYALALGIAGNAAGLVASDLFSASRGYPILRQFGGILIGILIGVLTGYGAKDIALSILNGTNTGHTEAFSIAFVSFVAFGLGTFLRALNWKRSVVIGSLYGVATGLPLWLIGGPVTAHFAATGLSIGGAVSMGFAISVLFSAIFGMPYLIAKQVAGQWVGGVAGILGPGTLIFLGVIPMDNRLLFSLSFLIALTQNWWRPVISYPVLAAWNVLLQRADEVRDPAKPSLLRWHSAFWDEFQRIPLAGLDDYLIAVAGHRPLEAKAALSFLVTSPQKWAAQEAQIELDARALARCTEVEKISDAEGLIGQSDFQGPATKILAEFSKTSADVGAALRQERLYHQRDSLTKAQERVEALFQSLTRSDDPHAGRFAPISVQWRNIISDKLKTLSETIDLLKEVENPYVIAVPLGHLHEIFKGRNDISGHVENLIEDRRRPPLFLYGQRRMGKTSLLLNLGRLLSTRVVPMYVDLQSPAGWGGERSFFYGLAKGMKLSAKMSRNISFPDLTLAQLADNPGPVFEEWLDQVETALGDNTGLLTLDEFEVLDSALRENKLDELVVLGTLRHLIQHRTRFKVLLAGSHTLKELERWSSHLINVRVLKIDYLDEANAQRLIETPVLNFQLTYSPGCTAQILNLTRRHPYLIQLLCSEIVSLKNEQEPARRRFVTLDDVNSAIPRALQYGRLFFADIQRNQVDEIGRAVLMRIALKGQGQAVSESVLESEFGHHLAPALASLFRRDLIERVDGGYKFQVELVRQWFAAESTTRLLPSNRPISA